MSHHEVRGTQLPHHPIPVQSAIHPYPKTQSRVANVESACGGYQGSVYELACRARRGPNPLASIINVAGQHGLDGRDGLHGARTC